MRRRARTAALAVICAVLTLVAHLTVARLSVAITPGEPGGIGAPAAGPLLVTLLLSLVVVGVLGRRRLPGWQVAGGLTLLQLLQHVSLSMRPADHVGHLTGTAAGTSAGTSIALAASMLGAHAVAGIATAALLGYGESAASALLRWLNWLRPLLWRPPRLVFPRRLPVVAAPGPARLESRLLGGPGLRGPPATCRVPDSRRSILLDRG